MRTSQEPEDLVPVILLDAVGLPKKVQPTKRPTSVLGSSLRGCCLGFRAHALLSQTRNPFTFRRRHVSALSGVKAFPDWG